MAVKDYVREHPSTVEEEIGRLETFVFRMERRYECKSDAMAREVREGRARNTAEISRWLGSYEALHRLREALHRLRQAEARAVQHRRQNAPQSPQNRAGGAE